MSGVGVLGAFVLFKVFSSFLVRLKENKRKALHASSENETSVYRRYPKSQDCILTHAFQSLINGINGFIDKLCKYS